MIRHCPYGIAVFGNPPVGEITALMELWSKQGYKSMDTMLPEFVRADGVADFEHPRHATMVIIKDEEAGKAWRKELDIRFDHPDWLRSGDAGISSKTIYAVMEYRWHIVPRGSLGFAPPGDADDFGRCYRLLKRYPAYLNRMEEVVEVCPNWKPIADHWNELCLMFEKEGKLDANGFPTVKRMPKTTKRIMELTGGHEGATLTIHKENPRPR
mgnify:FL=1